MSKYKVGDKVRVRENLIPYEMYRMEKSSHRGWVAILPMCELHGRVVTISEYDKADDCYHIEEMPNGVRWVDEMFEGLVEDKKVFTKSDLKNGDVIKKRNGNVEILVLPLGTLVCNDYGHNDIADINDDLTSKNGAEFDIVAVRRPTKVCHCTFFAHRYECGDLVYDRERDTKPLYNGKVVCIDRKSNHNIYTVGKIYQFKNGQLIGDNGKPYPASSRHNDCTAIIHNFEEWKNWSRAEWLEIKE